MLSRDEIKEYLKNNLQEQRYNHVLGVAETAKQLARLNSVHEDIAEFAGLAHDVAKNMKIDEMKKIIDDNNIILSEVEERNMSLWHSIIAPIVAREKLGIEDEEILSSLRWHTTGKENMTTLEKIIYIADMIEPTRNFDGLDELRNITFNNLDDGVLAGLTHTMKFLLDKNSLLDENTIKARNYLLIHSGK